MSTSYPPSDPSANQPTDPQAPASQQAPAGPSSYGHQQPHAQQPPAPEPTKTGSKAVPIIIGVIIGALAMFLIAWAAGLLAFSDETEPDSTTSEAVAEPADDTTGGEDGAGEATDPASETDGTTGGEAEDGDLPDEVIEIIDAQHRLDPADPRALGELEAPVIIELYSDYRCGYCRMFHEEVFPDLQPKIDDGTIRIEYNSMPVLGDASILAAQASHAAALQGKFWEFHDAAFAFEGEFTGETLAELASGIGGIDVDQFRADMESQETVDYVEAERQNGTSLGIQGTPTFIIGYSFVPGFIETPQFLEIIDHELDRQ